LQFLNLPVNHRKPFPGDAEGVGPAGVGGASPRGGLVDLQELVNVAKGETELLGVADEADALQIGIGIRAVAGGRAGRFAKESFTLVEAESLNAHASSFGEFANAHRGECSEKPQKRRFSLVSKKLMYQAGVMRDTSGFIEFSLYCC
jgi:hypothetical protein